MRNWVMAAAVLGVAGWTLVRVSHAGPPPPMERRELSKVLNALEKAKASPAEVATLRYARDVFGDTHVSAPVGSPLTTLGAWGQSSALASIEQHLSGCAPLTEAQRTAAVALLKQGGLPEPVRAFTLGESGKADEAAAALSAWVLGLQPKDCPREHPMYSYQRVGRMQLGVQCLHRFAPKLDLHEVTQALERAQACAANNHAVG